MKKWYIKCPFCANEIKEGAIKCSFCEEFLDSVNKWIKRNDDILPKGNKSKKLAITIMWVIIFILCCIIVFLFIKLNNNTANSNITNTFEKKKMCAEMRDEYEKYLKKTWNWEDNSWWHHYSVEIWDVDLFYSKEYDSCIWAYYSFADEDWNFSRGYVISDYMNWNKEILRCWTDKDTDCYSKRNKKVDDLKK